MKISTTMMSPTTSLTTTTSERRWWARGGSITRFGPFMDEQTAAAVFRAEYGRDPEHVWQEIRHG